MCVCEDRGGILGLIKTKAEEGVETVLLSQTFAHDGDPKFNGMKFRSPANKRSFIELYKGLKDINGVEYYVNESIHSKYIIVDNVLIYCTYNFTPTQFIYLDKVDIPKFDNMPELSYKGTHCEVAGHLVVENENLVDSFLQNMKFLIDLPETTKVI